MAAGFTKRVIYWLAEAAVLFLFWLVFTVTTAPAELLVGAAASLVAAAGAEAVRGLNLAEFYPYIPWLLEFRRVPGMVLDGCWVLVKVLVLRTLFGRDIRGELKTVDFDPGGSDPRSAARRALAVTFTTLAPNFIVLRIDRKERLLLYHQVMGSSVPEVTRRLGAKP